MSDTISIPSEMDGGSSCRLTTVGDVNGLPRVGKTTDPRFIPDGGALKSEMMQGCWHNIPTGTSVGYHTYMGTSTKGTENE